MMNVGMIRWLGGGRSWSFAHISMVYLMPAGKNVRHAYIHIPEREKKRAPVHI